MMIIITVDYEHWRRYMNVYFSSTLLVMSNSIISPVVYVWRYPECRYMLMAYCVFWNKEKQRELIGRLDQYNANYNLHGASGNPALSSEPERGAEPDSITHRTGLQDVVTISATIQHGNALDIHDSPAVSQSMSLTTRSDTLFRDVNGLVETAQTVLSRSTDSEMISVTINPANATVTNCVEENTTQ